MDRDERYLIRIMFKNRIFYSDAQAFEDLFTKIMRYGYPEFRAVKPQGAFGDKKMMDILLILVFSIRFMVLKTSLKV
ncbi:hypothetical protein KDJ93_08095 [Clostridium butyricum]|uniref:hypothetical protein n=1 Tax=Clostridium butyricum TaxID=1492 RepID=UPI001BAB96AF|nr:hypothetical protein [Clostridium butyricum]QUF84846.1 hypothetical protein KDJ93_08095 [Clostridium butyricum]